MWVRTLIWRATGNLVAKFSACIVYRGFERNGGCVLGYELVSTVPLCNSK
jgi:hypothetical protein